MDAEDEPGETYADRHGFLSWLGVTVEEREPGRIVLSLPARGELRNPGGALHGGVLATLIDHAGGAALRTELDRPSETPHASTDLNVSYLRPATSDLRAEARTLRVGASVAVVSVEVTSVAPDGERKAVAAGRVTLHLDRSGTPAEGGDGRDGAGSS
ncbi:MAG: PaaI family thioesterase [Haloarculaceae archaeon]